MFVPCELEYVVKHFGNSPKGGMNLTEKNKP